MGSTLVSGGDPIRVVVGHGPQGKPGKSAFEVAQEAGFAGTEEEWLASLAGADGVPGPASTVVVDDATFDEIEGADAQTALASADAAIGARVKASSVGVADGVAGLGPDARVPEAQLPERLSEAQQNATFVGRRVLLAFGNSLTNWWASGTRFTTELASRVGSLGDSLMLIEEGTGGADTDEMVAALPALLATYSPTWVTLPISINDRKTGALTPSESMANIEKMVGMCRWNGAGVILMTEPPLNPPVATVTDPNFTLTSESNRRIANDLLRTYAADNNLVLADVDAAFASNDTSASTDGIHPTGTLSGGESGLDAICATVVDAVLTASPEVFGWPLVLNGSGGDDDFERADNASTMGGSWTADDGTWGILDGRAYSVSAATWDRASVDTSAADHTIHVVGAGSPGVAYEPCVMTRFTNAASGYYFAVLTITAGRVGTAKLYRVNGMSPTQIGSSVVVPGTLGDTVELELASVGTLHTLRVNGMTTHRVTDATYPTGTRVGIGRLSTQLGFDEVSWRV